MISVMSSLARSSSSGPSPRTSLTRISTSRSRSGRLIVMFCSVITSLSSSAMRWRTTSGGTELVSLRELLDEALMHLAAQRDVGVGVAAHLAQPGTDQTAACAVEQGWRARWLRRQAPAARSRTGRAAVRRAQGSCRRGLRRGRRELRLDGSASRPERNDRSRRRLVRSGAAVGAGDDGAPGAEDARTSLCFPLNSVEQRHVSSNHLV